MWIWDPCCSTMVLWIVLFDFHLDLWEEVVEDNLDLLQYLTPASLWGNGLMGFGRRPPFSLHSLQLSTKLTSLKMKPVLLSSYGRVCETGNLTESQCSELDPTTPSLLTPTPQIPA